MRAARVISLLPSCTEIVCALGCAAQLKGRSHECDYPEEIRALPVCTSSRLPAEATSGEIDRAVKSLLQRALSLYEIDIDTVRGLRPDLILTQAQCEVCAVNLADVEEALAQTTGLHPKIVSLSPAHLADLWQNIQTVADALGVADAGRIVLTGLKERVVDIIQKTCLMKRRPTVACIEWMEPLMAAGNWIPELVDFAGGTNLFGKSGQHSPWLSWEDLQRGDPDMIILMPCGFGLERTLGEAQALREHPVWKTLRAVKSGKVFATDGNHFFNRPGPRLVDSIEILGEIIQPNIFTFGHAGKDWKKRA